MISAVHEKSLCQTCIHSETCFHCQNMKAKGLAVYFCEEFDYSINVLPLKNIQNTTGQEPISSSNNDYTYISGRMIGLCINCENRKTCRHPIREGGVWHCEDYY